MSCYAALAVTTQPTCHPKLCCQNDATSSNANSSPPIGALKAVATPTATPAVTKSRLSLGFLNRRKILVLNPRVVEWPWLSAAPRAAPMWIMGPSGPTGKPLATANAQLANLTTTVKMLNTCKHDIKVMCNPSDACVCMTKQVNMQQPAWHAELAASKVSSQAAEVDSSSEKSSHLRHKRVAACRQPHGRVARALSMHSCSFCHTCARDHVLMLTCCTNKM